MPVNTRFFRDSVGDIYPNSVALHSFYGRAMYSTVESPAVGHETRSKLMIRNLFGNKMKYLDPPYNRVRQGPPIGRNYGIIVLTRLSRGIPTVF
jgi:hypothetical protein